MGKSSKPQYSAGVVSVNGQEKASQYKRGNTVYSNYNMSDAEKNIYNYAQNSFLENLPTVNVFSDETKQNLQNQINAYKQKGIETINNIYSPMLSNLKSDIASRFGNFDNSVFLNKLNNIEALRSNSINALSQDVLAKENELVKDKLSNRYNYLNFLNGVQNQSTANALGYLNQAATNSSSGTNYNVGATDANNSYANMTSNIISKLGSAILAAMMS